MFLTTGALFILVVDIHAYSAENSREDALNQWLDILQSRVPGSVVLLVGTHSDLFGANSAECSERTEGFKAGGSWERNWCDVLCVRQIALFVNRNSTTRYWVPSSVSLHFVCLTWLGQVPPNTSYEVPRERAVYVEREPIVECYHVVLVFRQWGLPDDCR